jgi:predicted flap endonuclease-1-like 5' DNA nuclease
LEAAKGSADEAVAERAGVVERLEQDLRAERDRAAELTARMAELEATLAECIEQRNALESAPPAPIAASAPRIAEEAEVVAVTAPDSPTPSTGEAPSQEEGLARIAEIATRTAGDGPTVDDDLKKVHGIGPKLERTLKDLGITSFRQIANFEAEDIAYVTAALDAFKGRIERDDWMGSAATEHAKKYGEPV